MGFGSHAHRDMEIISCVLSGALDPIPRRPAINATFRSSCRPLRPFAATLIPAGVLSKKSARLLTSTALLSSPRPLARFEDIRQHCTLSPRSLLDDLIYLHGSHPLGEQCRKDGERNSRVGLALVKNARTRWGLGA
jgi:hypothetical protein